MNIEQAYHEVGLFFDGWVRVMELESRKMEVTDSANLGMKRLIISPPTDRGIPLIMAGNSGGETQLLCFSERLARAAQVYSQKMGVGGLRTVVKPFFEIPVDDNSLDVIYANCLFDFCTDEEIGVAVEEIERVLRPAGVLLAVFMEPPSTMFGRMWTMMFEGMKFASKGCHPVEIAGYASRSGFSTVRDISVKRLGFPARYRVYEKHRKVG